MTTDTKGGLSILVDILDAIPVFSSTSLVLCAKVSTVCKQFDSSRVNTFVKTAR